MRSFYLSLLWTTVLVLCLAIVLLVAASAWHTFVKVLVGPLEERWITYNASGLKGLIIDVEAVRIEVHRGTPKAHLYVRKFCRIEIVRIGDVLIVRSVVKHIPFQSALCEGVRAELWVPGSFEILKVKLNTASIIIHDLTVSTAHIIVNMGSARILDMAVLKMLSLENNMGSVDIHIRPGKAARINVSNNMGSISMQLLSEGATVSIPVNDMGSVRVLCSTASAPLITVINNMGSIAIVCVS